MCEEALDNENMAEGRGKPKLFLLSLILPAVWITIGLIFTQISPSARLGLLGTVIMYIFVAVGICWLILRRHNRMPTNHESWRLVAYCSVFAVIMESWALLAAATWPEDFPNMQVSPDSLTFLIGTSVVLNTLFLTLAFKVAAPRYLKNSIANLDE